MIKFSLVKTRSDMSTQLKLIQKQKEQVKEQALAKAGLAIIEDIVNVRPKPPIDTGFLRGSWGVFVGSTKIESGPNGPESHAGKRGELTAGLSTPYAARLHELPKFKTHKKPEINQDSGPKFVEEKLARFKEEYMRIIADDFKSTRDR